MAVHFVWEGEHYEIAASTVERFISGASSGRSYHAARTVFIDFMHDQMVQEIADRVESAFVRIDEGLEDIVHVAVEFEEVDGGHEGSENDRSEEHTSELQSR